MRNVGEKLSCLWNGTKKAASTNQSCPLSAVWLEMELRGRAWR